MKKGGKYFLGIKERSPAGKITYSIKNSAIATVSSDAVVTGEKIGTTSLTLTWSILLKMVMI